MKKKSITKIEIDGAYRLYIYKTKSVLKKKKGNRWIPVIVSKNPSDIIESSLINEELKKKMKEKLHRFFENRG